MSYIERGWPAAITEDQRQMREFIRLGICPWCAKPGPFAVLAQHTALVHGVYAGQLREIAGLYKHKAR